MYIHKKEQALVLSQIYFGHFPLYGDYKQYNYFFLFHPLASAIRKTFLMSILPTPNLPVNLLTIFRFRGGYNQILQFLFPPLTPAMPMNS